MQEYIKNILDTASIEQKSGKETVCLRCGINKLKIPLPHNAFSRYADVYICAACGTDEAMRDCQTPKAPLPFAEWNAVIDSVKGKTFLDLLRSGEEIDCDLIIGGSDMPASFVWDNSIQITEYGINRFSPIMISPYTMLPNGNIEIHCDDYRLARHLYGLRPDISANWNMTDYLTKNPNI